MKCPTEPKKPWMIFDEPQEYFEIDNEIQLSEYKKYSLQEFLDLIGKANLDKLRFIRKDGVEDRYGDYIEGCCTPVLVEKRKNPNYKKLLSLHKKKLEKYDLDMKEYDIKMEQYLKDKKAYDDWYKEMEISRLEKQLSKLKKKK